MDEPGLNQSHPESEIMVDTEVAALARCKVTQIRRWVKSGDFLAPRQIGAHKFWRKSEVLEFLFGTGSRAKNGRMKQ